MGYLDLTVVWLMGPSKSNSFLCSTSSSFSFLERELKEQLFLVSEILSLINFCPIEVSNVKMLLTPIFY